ncbi:MAG: hypothetical protein U0359_10360 [Byssovorax sp.]
MLVVDEASVYWTDLGAGTVSKAPKGGGPAVTVASGQSIAPFLAIDATNIYWWNLKEQGGEIMKTPKGGGASILHREPDGRWQPGCRCGERLLD